MPAQEHDYGHVARLVFDTPWYIREAEGRIIADVVRRRIVGERMGEDEIEARIAAARAAQGPRAGQQNAGPVDIVPIYGTIMPRASLITAMSGGTSCQEIRARLERSLSDPDFVAVIAEFDSPGGSVEGIAELATWIRAQRGRKPMVAVVNTMACSAAYILAAQFDEIVASPSSLTGDIGVFMEHTEFSKMDAELGVTTTIIRQPVAKHEINDAEPLTGDAAAYLQELVDDYYGQAIGEVAAGRAVTPAAVRGGYGQGRSMTAAKAKKAGLVDRVDTLEATYQRLAQGKARGARPQAEADIESPAAAVAALPFSDRIEAVTAEADEILAEATKRASLRADEGRQLSEATRDRLTTLAGSLAALAAQPEPEAEAEPAATPTAAGPKRRIGLELFELAARGGYVLPPQTETTSA